MKARDGQVALYLVLVLAAVAVLMFANLNMFLAVRAKNRMMNAVDAAAIAAARRQGALLNEVGRLNVEHLRAAVLGLDWVDEVGNDKMSVLRSLVFFGPVNAIVQANEAARSWGFSEGAESDVLDGFRDHISEIRQNPEFYPRAGDGRPWLTYADLLDRALGTNPAVVPRFMEVVNPGATGLFASDVFYDVLRARAWCWFGRGENLSCLDQSPDQLSFAEIVPAEDPENSEVFSLHLTFRGWLDTEWAGEYVSGAGFGERWTNFVCHVTGLSPADFSPSAKVLDPDQRWAFYDDYWNEWSPTFNPDDLPLAGTLKPEYDVAGCVAPCMMIGRIPQIEDYQENGKGVGTEGRRMLMTADAKPLGTVKAVDGGQAPVTAFRGFVAAAHGDERIFSEAQLVLTDTVPHAPGVGMEPEWYEHVKKHTPQGLDPLCGYCSLWRQWAEGPLRSEIRRWLGANGETCHPHGNGKEQKGGYRYAH